MKRKAIWSIPVVILLGIATSCVSISSQGLTDIGPSNEKAVKAKAKGFGVLHLTVPKLEKEGEARLLEQCDGEVVNVNSQLTMREFFIVQLYVLKLTGDCK